jgi:hypothetical protein
VPAGRRHDHTAAAQPGPLPDESLLGFLLRLAHRLDTSPLRLAQATGLLTDQAATRVPTRLLLKMTTQTATGSPPRRG